MLGLIHSHRTGFPPMILDCCLVGQMLVTLLIFVSFALVVVLVDARAAGKRIGGSKGDAP